MKNFEIFFHVRIDTSVIVNNIKKYSKNFPFLAKVLPWSADAHYDKKKFYCKIFCLQRKIDGAPLRCVGVCVQKLVFTNSIVCLLLKTNF